MKSQSKGARAKGGMVGLVTSGLVKLVAGGALMGALLFMPAGTLEWSGAWRLLAVLFGPMLVLGVVLAIFSPALLAKRLDAKESRSTQNLVVRLSGLVFIVGFVVAGLDFRWGWSSVPDAVVVAACALFLLSYILYAEVLRENEWLSRTIEVRENQQVVSSGLYGVVRHPMYMATVVMFLSMPLILGSWWSLVVFLFYLPIIVVRTLDEERLLRKELGGYEEYCRKVRWRIIPFVW